MCAWCLEISQKAILAPHTAMILLGSWTCGKIAHMTGVLYWRDTGYSGRTVRKARTLSCSLCKSRWNALSSVARWELWDQNCPTNQKQLHVHRPWSSWDTLTTLISPGKTTQQGTNKSGNSWRSLVTTSWHSWCRIQQEKVFWYILYSQTSKKW